jgi:probable rRNA maturation factor
MVVIKIEINNQQDKIIIDEEVYSLFQSIAEKAAELEGLTTGEISFALVNNEIIHKLNRQYRNQDKPTDVLSFPMDDEVWGDVVISTEQAALQAKEYGHSLKRELGYLAVHGVLHLLGYDHLNPEDKLVMRLREEQILEALKLKRGQEGLF